MVKSEDFTQPMDAEADVRSPKKVAMLTAGGLAPCLSSAVGYLIEKVREREQLFHWLHTSRMSSSFITACSST